MHTHEPRTFSYTFQKPSGQKQEQLPEPGSREFLSGVFWRHAEHSKVTLAFPHNTNTKARNSSIAILSLISTSFASLAWYKGDQLISAGCCRHAWLGLILRPDLTLLQHAAANHLKLKMSYIPPPPNKKNLERGVPLLAVPRLTLFISPATPTYSGSLFDNILAV